MKTFVNIPRKLTLGADLIVITKNDYEMLTTRLQEYEDAFRKIKNGEREYRRGKTRRVSSLAELR